MRHVHIPALAWNELHSPSRKFHSFTKNISAALGARWRDQPGEAHPFDLQLRRIPPGAAICPYHLHTTQWEMFIVLSGSGTVRANGERHAIAAGDVFVHPPGTAHQTINTGAIDLEVYIIADNPPCDMWYYPDSNKWGLAQYRKFFRLTELDYFDGEGEEIPPAAGKPPFAVPASTQPFQKVNFESLPWTPWESPKKKFRATSKELSMALGAKRNTPTDSGGHPFDLEFSTFFAGYSGCPFHSHAAQWELYLIVSGAGIARCGDERIEVKAGDVFVHPPFEAHQLTAHAGADLVFFLIADNPPVDYWNYPDSGKWGIRTPRHIFRMTDVDYFEGEE